MNESVFSENRGTAQGEYLNKLPSGVAVVTFEDGVLAFIYSNERFFTQLGYTREECRPMSLKEFAEKIFGSELDKVKRSFVNWVYSASTGDIELRAIHKDGTFRWFVLKLERMADDEHEYHYIISFKNITSLKITQLELQKEKERQQVLEEISDEIFIDYDVVNDVLTMSKRFSEIFGRECVFENAMEALTYDNIVDSRDIPVLLENINNAFSGQRTNIYDLRLNALESKMWFRTVFTAIYDKNADTKRFIGKMYNVDKEKTEHSRLVLQEQTDALTGFYNKAAAGVRVDEYIKAVKPGIRCALMVLDIDNFRKINDTFGRAQGDRTLVTVSQQLQVLFRNSDILGRTGGDEFIMLIRDIDNESTMIAEEKARDICEVFRNLSISSNNNIPLSCSMGIAVYPEDGRNYAELFTSADSAMYEAKARGKNQYVFYGK